LFSDPLLFIVYSTYLVPAGLLAIIVHEQAHGWMAYLLGDRSVRAFGYLRPQLRRYIEPYGLIAIFVANVGWGQPIPIQENRLSRGARVAYAFAGPVGSLVVAAIFGLLVRLSAGLGVTASPFPHPTPLSMVAFELYAAFFINLAFFAFNLLPIPGLDGWRVLDALLRRSQPRFFYNVESRRREIWAVIVLVIVVASFIAHINLLDVFLAPLYTPFSILILGTCRGYFLLSPCLLLGR
jgi:Zn-dependent protease